MSQNVTARLIIAPWNPEELAASADGQRLLDAIEEWGFDDTSEYDDHGVPVIELCDWEASYGTEAFLEDLEIVDLVSPLSLWCALSDEGGGGWDPHRIIYTPDGLLFKSPENRSNDAPMLSRDLYETLTSGGMDALDAYWKITFKSLGEWINEGLLHLGVSPAQDVVYKALIDPMYEVTSPSVSSERLAELALNKSPSVRQEVASNPNTPTETLVSLAGDEDVDVRHNVARNPSTSAPILNLLTVDENANVAHSARESLLRFFPESTTIVQAMGGVL